MLTELQPFIGRFHPLVVHLPIGFLLLAGAIELLARTRRFRDAGLARVMPALLGLSALATLGAIVTGTLLAGSGDYDAALVGRHQQWGLVLGAVVAIACAAAWWRTQADGPAPRRLYTAAGVATLVLVSVTGHIGGTLTHGEGYLTEHLPPLPFLSSARANADRAPVDLSATPVFATLVAPTLEARCVGCHGPARQAGKLRLDSPEAIRKGGEDGAVVVPGSARDSRLVTRVFLPASDRKVMPPKGHAPPSHAEMAVLRWWIDQGASFDQVLADADVPADLEAAIADRVGPVDFSAPPILSVRVQPADPKAIDAARALQLRIEPLRADTPLLVVEAPPAARAFDDEGLKALEPLASQIAWLDLSGTQVTDAGLTTFLPKVAHIWKLSLARTAATDRTLGALGKADRLEAINVYATAVGDAGLKAIEKLPRLRSVYAWQTRVTPEAAEALHTATGRVQVNLGAPPEPVAEQVAGDDTTKAPAKP